MYFISSFFLQQEHFPNFYQKKKKIPLIFGKKHVYIYPMTRNLKLKKVTELYSTYCDLLRKKEKKAE